MGKFKKLQEDIENVTNKEVVKQTRISGVATIVLIISVACAIGGMSYEDPNSSMPTFLFTASALLFLSGVIKLLVDRSCYMFKPTKSKLKTMTMYFDVHESDNLQDCMEMKRFEDLKKMKREKDTGVKVEAMIADDQKFAAVQISEYIPYSYEAVTPVMCYYGEEARLLASYLKVS